MSTVRPLDPNYSAWMGELPGDVKQLPINRLLLPGTHDSEAYVVDFTHPLGPTRWFDIANLAARILPCVGTIIRAWTITQEWRVGSQLEKGIRYLDLRVSFDPENEQFYLTHTFTCSPLPEVLDDMRSFLGQNREEILVISMKPGWYDREGMTPQRNDQLMKWVQIKLGDLLCKPPANHTFDASMTIEEMTKRNQRIVLFFGGKTDSSYDFVWDKTHLNIPWDNTSDLERKMEALEESLKSVKWSPDRLNGLSFTLTPQKDDVIRDVVRRFLMPCCYEPRSVRFLASEMAGRDADFIQDHKEPIVSKMSLLVSNFPEETFIRDVIRLNYLITAKQNFASSIATTTFKLPKTRKRSPMV